MLFLSRPPPMQLRAPRTMVAIIGISLQCFAEQSGDTQPSSISPVARYSIVKCASSGDYLLHANGELQFIPDGVTLDAIRHVGDPQSTVHHQHVRLSHDMHDSHVANQISFLPTAIEKVPCLFFELHNVHHTVPSLIPQHKFIDEKIRTFIQLAEIVGNAHSFWNSDYNYPNLMNMAAIAWGGKILTCFRKGDNVRFGWIDSASMELQAPDFMHLGVSMEREDLIKRLPFDPTHKVEDPRMLLLQNNTLLITYVACLNGCPDYIFNTSIVACFASISNTSQEIEVGESILLDYAPFAGRLHTTEEDFGYDHHFRRRYGDSPESKQPHLKEKNWAFFEYESQIYIIQQIYPLHIMILLEGASRSRTDTTQAQLTGSSSSSNRGVLRTVYSERHVWISAHADNNTADAAATAVVAAKTRGNESGEEGLGEVEGEGEGELEETGGDHPIGEKTRNRGNNRRSSRKMPYNLPWRRKYGFPLRGGTDAILVKNWAKLDTEVTVAGVPAVPGIAGHLKGFIEEDFVYFSLFHAVIKRNPAVYANDKHIYTMGAMAICPRPPFNILSMSAVPIAINKFYDGPWTAGLHGGVYYVVFPAGIFLERNVSAADAHIDAHAAANTSRHVMVSFGYQDRDAFIARLDLKPLLQTLVTFASCGESPV